MARTVVFAFAVEGAPLPIVEGAAPYAVLARQIPRLLVGLLNGNEDRGIRFFPFMGMVGEKRQFFDLDQPFERDELRSLHGQSAVDLLADGVLRADSIQLRVFEAEAGSSGRTVLEVEAPFNVLDPWPALARLMFELTGAIGWVGPVPALPTWTGPLLGWYWIARDDQLALEAQISSGGSGSVEVDPITRLRASVEAFALAPQDEALGAVMLETARSMLVRKHGDPTRIGEALLAALHAATGAVSQRVMLDTARVLEATLGLEKTLPIYESLLEANAANAAAAQRAGFVLFQLGRAAESLAVLRRSFDAGARDAGLRAQLAAAEEENGNSEARDKLLADLANESGLPVPVARLVASHLVDHDRAADALRLIDRVRRESGGVEHAGLWLERGRSLLVLNQPREARDSLERCLAVEPSEELRAEANRLLRLAGDSDLMPSIRELEAALQEGDLRVSAQRARALVRERPELAEAWLLLGVVRQRLTQPRRAIRAFERALKLQPDLGDAHNRLGVLLATRGRDLDGYGHLKRAVELIPHDSSPWLHLAQISLRLGYRDEAVEAFQHAERLGGHEAEVDAIRRLLEGGEAS